MIRACESNDIAELLDVWRERTAMADHRLPLTETTVY